MKNLLIALSLAVAAGPAFAASAPDGKPAAKMEMKAGAATSVPVIEQATAPRMASRAHVDARECLKLATNKEIHGCAEKYR